MPRRGTKHTKGVYGPYYEPGHDRWRAVATDPGNGSRRSRYFASEEEALLYIEERRSLRLRAKHIETIFEDYLTYLYRVKGRKKKSVETTGYRLQAFLLPSLSLAVEVLTPRHCQTLYTKLTERKTRFNKPTAVDTHRNALKEFRAMARWMIKEGYLKEDPAAEIEPEGRKKKGKPQLRVAEARKWMAKAIELWEKEGNVGALAALTTLLLGLRVSEVLERKVRDVDDEGKLLWVGDLHEDNTKNEGSVRRMEIPDSLRPHLLALIEGKEPEAPLWPYHSDQWVLRTVKLICERAQVPMIVTHSLRGIHATLAEAAGVSSHLVNQSLGWKNEDTKNAHYVSKEVQGLARQSRALNVLEGGK